MSQRLAVVTGSNRGIGIDIVSGLLSCLPADFDVMLTGRSSEAMAEAVHCLQERHYADESRYQAHQGRKDQDTMRHPFAYGTWFYTRQGAGPRLGCSGLDRLRTCQLDLSDVTSICRFGEHVRDAYGRVDVLVNNAGAPARSGPAEHVGVDHFGHLALYHAVLHMIQPGARLVHVGSQSGALRQFSPEIRQRVLSASLTEEELNSMLLEYLTLAQQGRQQEAGWPGGHGYSVAKMANATTARIQARELSQLGFGDDILVNACCPGPANAPYTQKGAHIIVSLATLPPGDGRTGRWFEDRGWTGQPREVSPE